MNPIVHRAGSVVDLAPLSMGQAMKVGLMVGWATAAAAAMDPRPHQRPVGACWSGVIAAGGLFGLVVGGTEGLAAEVAVGAAGFFMVIMVLGPVVEGLLFEQAARVWLVASDVGRACAKVNEAASGAWELTSVAAWPFKRDLGSHRVGEICRDADQAGREIVLQARNGRVARLYTRHNFAPDPVADQLWWRRLPTQEGVKPHLHPRGGGPRLCPPRQSAGALARKRLSRAGSV